MTDAGKDDSPVGLEQATRGGAGSTFQPVAEAWLALVAEWPAASRWWVQMSRLSSTWRAAEKSIEMGATVNLDPRVAFYLEHREQIDDWCRIRAEIAPAAHRFLASVAEPALAQAEELEGKPLMHVDTDCEYPKILYYLPSWRGPGTIPARVAVGIEWVRQRATFDTAYTGVWVDCRHPEGSVLSARLEAVFCEMASTGGYVRRNQWFPAQRVERPSAASFWTDLDGFRLEIVRSLGESWRHFSRAISITV